MGIAADFIFKVVVSSKNFQVTGEIFFVKVLSIPKKVST